MKNRVDKTTKEYLENVKKECGLLGSNAGECLSLCEILKKKDLINEAVITKIWEGEVIGDNTVLYKYELEGRTRYCSEIWVRYDIDGVYVHTFIFDRIPTKNEIRTIMLAENLEVNISIRRTSPVFHCWKCGKERHWLDGNPAMKDFGERYNNLQNSYCGC